MLFSLSLILFCSFYIIPDKRNIVYVGQLEEADTKDALKKKFVKYGIIKNISLHQKENG